VSVLQAHLFHGRSQEESWNPSLRNGGKSHSPDWRDREALTEEKHHRTRWKEYTGEEMGL
jgi:hypothetical protein